MIKSSEIAGSGLIYSKCKGEKHPETLRKKKENLLPKPHETKRKFIKKTCMLCSALVNFKKLVKNLL